MENWWKSWEEINHFLRDKILVLYGRSDDWIPKSLKKLKKTPSYIVDSNKTFSGTFYDDIPIVSTDKLLKENRDNVYIVITTGNYHGVVTFLVDNGFTPGLNFSCSPEYRSLSLLEDIRNYEQEVIISCSDYDVKTKARYSRAGGGLYLYHIGPNKLSLLSKGSFRQVIQVGDIFYAIDHVDPKVCIFDKDFKVLDNLPLDQPKYCGIAYNEKRKVLILTNAEVDTISIHDVKTFKLLERLKYSDRYEEKLTSQHHLNDVCVTDDHLYVSYFSHSGNWKKGVYDGGISELNLDCLSEPPVRIVEGLWKPHSPKIIDAELCYLDSMRGILHTTTHVVEGVFPGFVRGLAHDGRFFYIGQSEHMYVHRLVGIRNNIMLNAGFYLFDRHTKSSRFYPMLDNMNVHDILIRRKDE